MYETQVRLMCVLAHPDDESMAVGGLLAHYGEQNVEIALICATRGEHGWQGPQDNYPGGEALGQLRTRELLSAAEVLGVQHVHFLGYEDGRLDEAEPDAVISQIVSEIRRFRPQVVVTFDPLGAYGHPDHIAISQFTSAAIVAAANPLYFAGPWPPFQVEKLYYLVWTQPVWERYEAIFGKLETTIDGVERRAQSWVDWAVTTRLDTADQWQRVVAAILCHGSQVPSPSRLMNLSEANQRQLWGQQHFYRVFSLVNGGRHVETDLFEGIRTPLPRGYYRRTPDNATQPPHSKQASHGQSTYAPAPVPVT